MILGSYADHFCSVNCDQCVDHGRAPGRNMNHLNICYHAQIVGYIRSAWSRCSRTLSANTFGSYVDSTDYCARLICVCARKNSTLHWIMVMHSLAIHRLPHDQPCSWSYTQVREIGGFRNHKLWLNTCAILYEAMVRKNSVQTRFQ